MTDTRYRNPLKYPEFQKNLVREAPVFANINLLGTCNVDCYFCLGKDIDPIFKQFNHIATHFSKWANFGTFLAKCQTAGIKNLYITGQNTDALVYKYLHELIAYLQDTWGFDVGIRTNGYLAHRYLETMSLCRRSVGLSIHSLNPDTNWTIMRRRDIPDWDSIIPAVKNVRVSIVLNRYNRAEFWALLQYISKFPSVKYIQVRRVCTDTREEYLIDDAKAYDQTFTEVADNHPVTGYFYSAEMFRLYNIDVCFWRTMKTTIDSFNYYTDGTINDEYFVIEGYMRDSASYPKNGTVPDKVTALEGYWRT
jgi:molybdenum cofactor biosynthesis enzyme MoaA